MSSYMQEARRSAARARANQQRARGRRAEGGIPAAFCSNYSGQPSMAHVQLRRLPQQWSRTNQAS